MMKKIMLGVGIALGGFFTFKTTGRDSVPVVKKAAVIAAATAIANNIVTDEDFYKAVLKGLEANVTAEKIKFLRAWRQGEGGQAKNNPFNTTKDEPGNTRYNSVGVRNYPDRKTGLDATVATLKLPYYTRLVALLKKDCVTARELAQCRALKVWGTGSRVKKVLAMGTVNPPAIVS